MRRLFVLLAGISLLSVVVGCKCGGCGCHGGFTAGVCDCDHSDRGCSYYGDPIVPYRAGPFTSAPAGGTKQENIKEMPKSIEKSATPEPEKKPEGQE
jgi:hypothetical protein